MPRSQSVGENRWQCRGGPYDQGRPIYDWISIPMDDAFQGYDGQHGLAAEATRFIWSLYDGGELGSLCSEGVKKFRNGRSKLASFFNDGVDIVVKDERRPRPVLANTREGRPEAGDLVLRRDDVRRWQSTWEAFYPRNEVTGLDANGNLTTRPVSNWDDVAKWMHNWLAGKEKRSLVRDSSGEERKQGRTPYSYGQIAYTGVIPQPYITANGGNKGFIRTSAGQDPFIMEPESIWYVTPDFRPSKCTTEVGRTRPVEGGGLSGLHGRPAMSLREAITGGNLANVEAVRNQIMASRSYKHVAADYKTLFRGIAKASAQTWLNRRNEFPNGWYLTFHTPHAFLTVFETVNSDVKRTWFGGDMAGPAVGKIFYAWAAEQWVNDDMVKFLAEEYNEVTQEVLLQNLQSIVVHASGPSVAQLMNDEMDLKIAHSRRLNEQGHDGIITFPVWHSLENSLYNSQTAKWQGMLLLAHIMGNKNSQMMNWAVHMGAWAAAEENMSRQSLGTLGFILSKTWNQNFNNWETMRAALDRQVQIANQVTRGPVPMV